MSMHPGKPTDDEQDAAAEEFYGAPDPVITPIVDRAAFDIAHGLSPAPVVAEVRRAPRFNRHDVAFNEATPLWVSGEDARNLEAEVARLTAERDEWQQTAGEYHRRVDLVSLKLSTLRTRLRGLEQQWRDRFSADVCGKWQGPHMHDFDGFCQTCGYSHGCHLRKVDADELARLLTTPEEPGT